MFSELITDLLKDGFKVSFTAPGHSMFPTIIANETVLVEPIEPSAVSKGDIVLYRSNGNLIAHRVMGIVKDDKVNDYLSLWKAFCPGEEQSAAETVDGGKGSSSFVGDIQIDLFNRHSKQSGLEAERPLLKFCDRRNAPQGLQRRSSSEAFFFILRGDACFDFDEPVASDRVMGKVVFIQRNGRSINPYSRKHKLTCRVRIWASRLERLLS
jgi:signal peptidase I